jgi:hypothetical protein
MDVDDSGYRGASASTDDDRYPGIDLTPVANNQQEMIDKSKWLLMLL